MSSAGGMISPTFEALAENIGRIEQILGQDLGGAEHPFQRLMRSGAEALGIEARYLPRPHAGEATETSLRRIGEAAGLLLRPVAVDARSIAQASAPILVTQRSTGEMLLLLPQGKRRRIVHPAAPPEAGWLDTSADHDFEDHGFLLGPRLPEKPVTRYSLALFGRRMVAGELAVHSGMMALAGLLLALVPILTAQLIGTIVPGGEMRLLAGIALMLAMLLACHAAVLLTSGIALLRIEGRLGPMLRAAAIDRAVRLPPEQRMPVPPPIMAQAIRSVEGWHRLVWKLALGLVASLFVALPSLLVMAFSAPAAALAVFSGAMLMVAVCAGIMLLRRKPIFPSPGSVPASWMATAHEGFVNVETIRESGAETAMFNHWAEGFVTQQRGELASSRLAALASGLSAALTPLLLALAIGAVILTAAALPGEAGISLIMATTVVIGAVHAAIGAIGQSFLLAREWKLAEPLLSSVPLRSSQGEHLWALKGAIRVVAASYRYQAGHALALSNASIEIGPGEHVGITGASGSGKSTLLHVILGMKMPETGAVFIDGVDIRSLDMPAIRRRIGIVGQGASLFPGTLRDNIALGLRLSDAAILDCLALAGMRAEVEALPLGLGTVMGDTNPIFSGGEVQRLLFARALASRPKILLLDEATNALDPAAQAVITRSLRARGISILAVAHRLETLQACDRLYVMDRGAIVQHGTFTALARRPGLFAALLAAGQFSSETV
ncbi:MAG: ATP-binding cassette domain-containing protein [Methylobacterium sp.]|nr:ATP-binding cassette domain-containing protein [Methylobacterium sp.]